MGKKPAAPCSYIRGLSCEELSEIEESVIQLREAECNNADIAEILELSEWHVNKVVTHLLANRRTTSRYKKDTALRDLENERTKTIIAMVQQRATLEEIGKVIGVTSERARQLIEKITKEHGAEVFDTEDPVLRTHEVAKRLGVSSSTIQKIYASGEIACQKRSVGRKRSAWLLKESEIEEIKRHPLITGKRSCVICGKLFAGLGRSQACSDKCKEKRRREMYEAMINKESEPDGLSRWAKELWQQLRSHDIPKEEEWVVISEACRRTGLSKMQLTWLRLRRIVTIKPHPHKKWRGRPVATYAVSEIKIARQVYKRYCRRKRKK